jgi:ParB-like chromosome segregation protein Spo0J
MAQITAPKDALEPSPELIADIGQRGVLEPLLLQAMGLRRYTIISGRRRYRAGQINGSKQFPRS